MQLSRPQPIGEINVRELGGISQFMVNGETPPALRANVAAVQVAGLSGGVTVYRP